MVAHQVTNEGEIERALDSEAIWDKVGLASTALPPPRRRARPCSAPSGSARIPSCCVEGPPFMDATPFATLARTFQRRLSRRAALRRLGAVSAGGVGLGAVAASLALDEAHAAPAPDP